MKAGPIFWAFCVTVLWAVSQAGDPGTESGRGFPVEIQEVGEDSRRGKENEHGQNKGQTCDLRVLYSHGRHASAARRGLDQAANSPTLSADPTPNTLAVPPARWLYHGELVY